MASLPVLIICTSHSVLGGTGYPTGVWSTEAMHPWHVFTNAGLKVVFASPKGGVIPLDPYSDPRAPVSLVKGDAVVDEFLVSAACMASFNSSLPTSSIDPAKYAAVFVAGGNGALFDLPKDEGTLRILDYFANKSDRPFGSVCHGSAALLEVRAADGATPFVQGKRVTGFDNEEEAIAGAQIGVPYLPFFLETELRKRGALFLNGPPFGVFATADVDGRFVCGQQNFSGAAAAELILAALLKRERLSNVQLLQSSAVADVFNALVGSWTSAHLERVHKRDGRLLFRRRTFVIRANGTFDLLADVYADAQGKTPVFSLFFTGPFELEEPSPSQKHAWNSKWGHTRWWMVPQSAKFIADVLQKDPRTKDFFWEVGVPVDVSEHGAIDVPSIAEGVFEYDIVAASQDGQKLIFGHRGFEPPMHQADRHRFLSCDYFVRTGEAESLLTASLRWNKSSLLKKWAIVGKGKLGSALGAVLKSVGHDVAYAARDAEAAAVANADVVVLAIPAAEVANLLKRLHASLEGKLVVDATNNIGPNFSLVFSGPSLPDLLPKSARAIKCFNTLGQASLSSPMSGSVRKDMFFCGGAADDKVWLRRVLESLGFAGVDMGDWSNAKSLEAVAQLWIFSAYGNKQGPNIAWKLLKH